MTKDIYELSFALSSLYIDGHKIEEFVDDSHPIEFQPVEETNVEWSLNGDLIRCVKPSGILLSVSVWAVGEDNKFLHNLFKERFFNDGNPKLSACDSPITGELQLSSGFSLALASGTVLSALPMADVSSKGRIGGVKYTFLFTIMD